MSHREMVFPRAFIDQVLCLFTRNMQIAQALQMQMEVQRKLHEQIEVAHIVWFINLNLLLSWF